MGETVEAIAVMNDLIGPVVTDGNAAVTPEPIYCISCHSSQSESWVKIEGQSYCSRDCYDRRWERMMREINVPGRFLSASFATFTPIEGMSRAVTLARKLADTPNPVKGLFLYGSVGSGKTHLMAAIIRQRVENGCESSRMAFWPILDLMSYIKRKWSKREWDPQNRIKRMPLLFIDDLGMEIVRDWTYQEFLSLVTYRYNEMLPMCITSNLTEAEFLDRYGNALFSRISEMCEPIKIEAPDYRLIA